MISVGRNIRSSSDELMKASIDYLHSAIRNPKPQISAMLNQLRIVRQLNPPQYSELKKQLPYFVCGVFNPPCRKIQNFGYTQYFIIDVDHVRDIGSTVSDLKSRITNDSRVLMAFVSPSGDGLKILFRLKERCYDSNQYRIFYRVFAEKYSRQYGLDQVLDAKTCDVSRACFISSDPDIYYNPNCENVDMEEYVDSEADARALSLLLSPKESTATEVDNGSGQSAGSCQKETESKTASDKEPCDDVMAQIRKTLNPNATNRTKEKAVYVPHELNDILESLSGYIKEKGVEIVAIRDISYGKKFSFKLGFKTAEVNLFFGKHGFSVIQSPKSGTDPKLNELMTDVLKSFLVERI